MNSIDKRQEIYDRIKASGGRQEFILKEMERLGFWDKGHVDYEAVNAFLTKERELSKELGKLYDERRIINDPEKALERIHQERMAASRQKQQETRERREQLRKEKAEAWANKKATDITYLGDGAGVLSHTLRDQQSDVARLQALGLPVLSTAADLAKAMGITVGELRFLTYSRKHSPISHYSRFRIPKRTGGTRTISAPMQRLKAAQHWVLHHVLDLVRVHDNARGCVKGQSIMSNAQPHVGKAVVINQDFKDFFPSITYERIRGVFRSLGYSGQLATLFALLCSEPEIREINLFGKRMFAQRGPRHLPQGAPTSPALTNLICRKLDSRLTGLASKYGFDYTRYVDDITFSGSKAQLASIPAILKFSGSIVKEEEFALHPKKLRIMKNGNRKEVTGIVVNEKLNVNRKDLRNFRALIHQVEKDGPKGKTWKGNPNVLSAMHGYAHFVNQVNPEWGAKLLPRVEGILEIHRPRSTNNKPSGLFDKLKGIFGSRK